MYRRCQSYQVSRGQFDYDTRPDHRVSIIGDAIAQRSPSKLHLVKHKKAATPSCGERAVGVATKASSCTWVDQYHTKAAELENATTCANGRVACYYPAHVPRVSVPSAKDRKKEECASTQRAKCLRAALKRSNYRRTGSEQTPAFDSLGS